MVNRHSLLRDAPGQLPFPSQIRKRAILTDSAWRFRVHPRRYFGKKQVANQGFAKCKPFAEIHCAAAAGARVATVVRRVIDL